MSEHIEQRDFVAWFRRRFPGVLIFAIPNGGARNSITAQKLKVEGVTRGVPDLLVPEWLLWIEMKAVEKSKITKEQKKMHEYLRKIGHTVIVPRGAVDAVKMTLAIRPTP